ncbi:MAG: PD-(D/E)XK nuclease family protein [Desulfotomaculum sp.]|nr:PD-(D/E)XK nuclease family protein [Desulfotomaculum sp.]
MAAVDLKEMYFSQNSLSTYDSCYLKFRRRYIDGLYWPGSWVLDRGQRELMEQGQVFHHLAQRYYSGIPVGDLEAGAVGPVADWFERLKEFRPFTGDAVFLPEQELRIDQEGIRLVAKYDLLVILPDGRAVIYDWKTAPTPPKNHYYRRHMQTIVYCYLLVKAGGMYAPGGRFSPGDISMIYWNPRFPKAVEPLVYSEEKYHKDERIIRAKIKEIESREYEDFYATSNEKICRYCEYSPICHGKPAVIEDDYEEEEEHLNFDWNDIDETIFE